VFSALSVSEPEKRKVKVELGPFFLVGAVLFAYGLLRRRPLAAAAGLGAIWFDQRSEVGRSLKKKARAKYMTVQIVDDKRDRPGEPELDGFGGLRPFMRGLVSKRGRVTRSRARPALEPFWNLPLVLAGCRHEQESALQAGSAARSK
jgi:hypothetical protein